MLNALYSKTGELISSRSKLSDLELLNDNKILEVLQYEEKNIFRLAFTGNDV